MTHVDFIRAVSSEFMAIFEKDPMPAAGQIPEIKAVDETVLKQKDERAEYIRKGMDELTSWEWTYGSTPEFHNTVELDLPERKISICITSKHALITDVSVENNKDRPDLTVAEDLEPLRTELIGQVYPDIKLSLSGSRNRFVTAVVELLGRVL